MSRLVLTSNEALRFTAFDEQPRAAPVEVLKAYVIARLDQVGWEISARSLITGSETAKPRICNDESPCVNLLYKRR
jgi:predicted RNA-binding Zn ribbon-like protein